MLYADNILAGCKGNVGKAFYIQDWYIYLQSSIKAVVMYVALL
jgi:hypothetical protein